MLNRTCKKYFLMSLILILFFATTSVLAISDITDPEVTDFRFEENGKILTAGDALHISAIVTDESEIERPGVWIFRINASSSSWCVYLDYNENTGRWEGVYELTENDKDGPYYISGIGVKDYYGNDTDLYFSQEEYYFYINESGSEIDKPEITDFKLGENGKALTKGDTCHVTMKVTDVISVKSTTIYFLSEENNGFQIECVYDSSLKIWTGEYTITDIDVDGKYHVEEIESIDIFDNNSKFYDYQEKYIEIVTNITPTNTTTPTPSIDPTEYPITMQTPTQINTPENPTETPMPTISPTKTPDIGNEVKFPIGDGEIKVGTVIEPGVPESEINNLNEETVKSLITEDEFSQVESGETLTFTLDVKDLGDDVSPTDKNLCETEIKNQSDNGVIGMFLDMTFYKRIRWNPQIKLSFLNNPLSITFKVPEHMRGIPGRTRNFYIIRIHNGHAEILANTTNTSISFWTDRFSTYALAYSDEPEDVDEEM